MELVPQAMPSGFGSSSMSFKKDTGRACDGAGSAKGEGVGLKLCRLS